MIKGIILDVDGVIVGEKVGYNSPMPHLEVLSRLKQIRQKEIPIFLCTAKPHYSIQKIIDKSELKNLHITNGGSVVIDPINNIILKKNIIESDLVIKVIREYLKEDIYTEFYTMDDYFIEKREESKITQMHIHILERNPVVVESLESESKKNQIVKIMPIAINEKDKERVIKRFDPFKNELTLSFGVHPFALPHQFGIITAKNISKKQAVREIMSNYNIKPDEILGIGDSTSDWQFIEMCKYAGTVENGSTEIKNLIGSKGNNNFFIGKSVNENGILDIFDHFNL